jgi:hypothetical protein
VVLSASPIVLLTQRPARLQQYLTGANRGDNKTASGILKKVRIPPFECAIEDDDTDTDVP